MAIDPETVRLVEQALAHSGCPSLIHGAADAARFCGRSPSAIRRAVTLQHLRVLRVGSARGRFLFLRADLAAFLAASEGV